MSEISSGKQLLADEFRLQKLTILAEKIYFIYSMGPKVSLKKLVSYAFSEVSSNIHWSGVGTEENSYLSEVINLSNIHLSNIHLSRFNCI